VGSIISNANYNINIIQSTLDAALNRIILGRTITNNANLMIQNKEISYKCTLGMLMKVMMTYENVEIHISKNCRK
jgi:hypothetical protein